MQEYVSYFGLFIGQNLIKFSSCGGVTEWLGQENIVHFSTVNGHSNNMWLFFGYFLKKIFTSKAAKIGVF